MADLTPATPQCAGRRDRGQADRGQSAGGLVLFQGRGAAVDGLYRPVHERGAGGNPGDTAFLQKFFEHSPSSQNGVSSSSAHVSKASTY